MDDWRSTISTQERTQFVTELAQILADMSRINGGEKANFNLEKLKKSAEQFESSLYASCNSKDLYLDAMRKRIAAMDSAKRKSIEAQRQKLAQAQAQAQAVQRQQQQQHHMQQQGSGQQQANGIPANINAQMFLNQQAQARQQAQRQIRSTLTGQQQQQPMPQQPQPQQPQQQQPNMMRPQLTLQQQQQLANELKVTEIPRELLQKIPNLPPGITTWPQITFWAQKNRPSQNDLIITKKVYQLHQQLLIKSKLQQSNVNRMNTSVQQPGMGVQQSPNQRMNMNQVPQQQQQVRQQQQQQQQQQHKQQPQHQEPPAVLGRLNQVFTQAEQKMLYEAGKKMIENLQRSGKLPPNLDSQQQLLYIKKYMNQMVLKKMQQLGIPIPMPGSAQQQSQLLQQQQQQQQQRQQQIPQVQQAPLQQPQVQPPQSQQAQSRRQAMGMKPTPVIPNAGVMKPQPQQTPQNIQQPMMQQQSSPPQQQQQQQQQQQSKISVPRPTEQDMLALKKLNAEVTKNPVKLNDITNRLTNDQKQQIRSKLHANQQLFSSVESFIPTLYMLTRNEEHIRQLLQIRMLTREIMEKAVRGVFLVEPNVVDKVIFRYQKYYEYTKEQLLRRQQQLMTMRQMQNNNPNLTANDLLNQQQLLQNRKLNLAMQSQTQESPQITAQQQQQPQQPISGVNNNSNMGIVLDSSLNATSRSGTNTMEFLNSPEFSAISPAVPSPNKDKKNPATRAVKGKKNSQSGIPTSNPQSNINASVVNSRTATPTVIPGSSPMFNNKSLASGQQNSPSPKTMINSPPQQDNPYKNDELALKKMAIRTAELMSRYKHRKEVFVMSSIDLFLSTFADCLDIKDDAVDLVHKTPQPILDQINGTGKKKLSKAAQKARDQDPVEISVRNNKLLMPSKSEKTLRSFKIPIADITACFKPFADPKQLILNSTPKHDEKKRKFDDLEISPTDSSSELMSESKKVKFDSPDDMFLNDPSSVQETKPLVPSELGMNSINSKPSIPSSAGNMSAPNESTDSGMNIWDWNYWESL